MRTTAANGWKIIHQARSYNPRTGEVHGQWLGRDSTTGWVVGRLHPSLSRQDDGFGEDGSWWYSNYYQGDQSEHRNRLDAAAGYLRMAKEVTHAWSSIFEQRVEEALDRELAGRVPWPGVDKLAAGWEGQPVGQGVPIVGSTALLPPTEAKRYLLGHLRSTTASAALHITPNSISYEQAEALVVAATGSIRFEFGRNTYWLSEG
ncbi:hypothetical protein [Kitasatospora sp. NPDC098663]|uniref:hypothetical protein n=1 Tax=Kitasatospora sp. NPDC098663 TaxID=3364096 RepID=UPI003800F953